MLKKQPNLSEGKEKMHSTKRETFDIVYLHVFEYYCSQVFFGWIKLDHISYQFFF